MSQKLMIKMMADFVGITPEQIMEMVEDGRAKILEGIELIQSIEARLARIENALNIHSAEIVPMERIENAERENGNGN